MQKAAGAPWFHRFFWALQIVTAAAFIGWIAFFIRSAAASKTTEKPLPVYASVPAFSMIERSGRTVTDKDLLGRPWVADFIFTRCPGQCPLMSAQMRRLQAELSDMRLVSFTVDPAFDTPKVLSAYAEGFGATSRWLFLNGGRAQTDVVIAAFKLAGVDEPAMHSVDFILIDGQNRVRGYYDGTDAAALARLAKDSRGLIHKEN